MKWTSKYVAAILIQHRRIEENHEKSLRINGIKADY
jgi:hypothetical protein